MSEYRASGWSGASHLLTFIFSGAYQAKFRRRAQYILIDLRSCLDCSSPETSQSTCGESIYPELRWRHRRLHLRADFSGLVNHTPNPLSSRSRPPRVLQLHPHWHQSSTTQNPKPTFIHSRPREYVSHFLTGYMYNLRRFRTQRSPSAIRAPSFQPSSHRAACILETLLKPLVNYTAICTHDEYRQGIEC